MGGTFTAKRWLGLAAGLCILASLWVCARRARSIWQAAAIEPGMAVTSGCEEASLYAVWQVAHGSPAYADSSRIPFAASYFNWLFYEGYGAALRPFVGRLAGAALTLEGRALTALGMLVGMGCLYWMTRATSALPPPALGALCLFAFCGPLVGWWGFTVRPDIWALALETAGMAAIVLYGRSHGPAAAVASAALFFLAWSFKQSFVIGAVTSLVFLAATRRWRLLGLFGGTLAVLLVAAWCILGPTYRKAMGELASHNAFLLPEGLSNLADAARKTAPLVLAAVLGLCAWARADGGPRAPSDPLLFGSIALVVAVPECFIAGCKVGAASNYYITCGVLLALVASCASAQGRCSQLILAAALVAAALEQTVAATGARGRMDLVPQAEELAASWRVWRAMPEPRFSSDTRLNVPWLNPGSPAFVLAFKYDDDRRSNRAFEGNGIGGLIERGYFQSLLLPAGTGSGFDGGSLGRYARVGTVGDLELLRLRR